ncbi:MAG: hypothetical protein RIE53_02170 [Rhodothermales bacterium]
MRRIRFLKFIPLLMLALPLLVAWPLPHAVQAQPADPANRMAPSPSPAKAFGLSMLLPGLGHRHANGGKWTAWSGTIAATDAALWIGLFSSTWHRNDVVDTYRTLAAGSAGAELDGKDRTFYLNLASFRSSDEFLETVLRNRAWDQVDYVADPSFHWSWASEAEFQRYRDLREQDESLGRRRSILIASLVANRIINGLVSARKASAGAGPAFSAGFAPPVGARPVLSLRLDY